MAGMEPSADPMRLDRWLWAARFFKTRGVAAAAVRGGRVELNGQPAKAAKDDRPADRDEIAMGQVRLSILVRATAPMRGPAAAAALLYDETAESRAERERVAAERRRTAAPGEQRPGRPTKRDRRRMEAARGRRGR